MTNTKQVSLTDIAEQIDNTTTTNTDTPTTETKQTPTTPKRFSRHNKTNTTKQTNTTPSTANNTTVCPECSGTIRDMNGKHERHCSDCGLVLEDQQIDHGPEWRAYDAQEREQKARTGAPSTQLVHDKGLSTTIDWKNKDANGKTISNKKKRKMSRLRKWDERARAKDSSERNLKQALGEIERMASALDIPKNVREMASVIYRRCLNDDLLRGRCIESMTTASLYAAARQAKLPRSMDEFVTVSRLEEQPITSAYRYICRELSLEVEPPDATDHIPKIASSVDVVNETIQLAENLLREMVDSGEHSGKHPDGLAAASLYAADLLQDKQNSLTQEELAVAADVCEVTIRNRHREILELNNEEPRLASPGSAE